MWNSGVDFVQDNGWYRPKPAGGGGGASYNAPVTATDSSAGTSATVRTFVLNLGSGAQFCVMGLFEQNSIVATDIKINGTALTLIDSVAAGPLSMWAGTPTLTGTDSVVITFTSTVAFQDVSIGVWVTTSLASTTKISSANGVANSLASAASIGNFVFAFGQPAANFTGSAQAPANQTTVTAGNGGVTTFVDWTASAGGISGGNFTATPNVFSNLVMGVWH